MERRATVTAEENDAFTHWRRRYAYLQKAGETSRIKRGANRRERRQGKAGIQKELREAA